MSAGRPRARVRSEGGKEGGEEEGSAPLSLSLDASVWQELKPGLEYGVELASAEALLLLRQRPGQTGFFAGTLSALSLGELFGQVLSGIRSGRLLVQTQSARRILFFRDAQVVFASSTARHERLGSILLQLGQVDEAALKSALAEVKPGAKVGQVLIRRGLLSQSALYSAMTFLVREIVVNLFALEEGTFLFVEGAQPPEDSVKLPERTRDLVLEGMKRGEEVQRLRKRLPEERLLSAGKASPVEEPAALWSLLKRGPVSVGELRQAFRGSEHAFYSLLSEQLGLGTLEEAPEPKPVPEAPSATPLSVPDRYGELIRQVCETLQDSGVELDSLRAFLSEPQPGLEEAFVGVSLEDSGVLDVARVISNLSSGGDALARAMAYEALDAFVSYALFVARDLLPSDLSAPLVEAYRAIQNEGG